MPLWLRACRPCRHLYLHTCPTPHSIPRPIASSSPSHQTLRQYSDRSDRNSWWSGRFKQPTGQVSSPRKLLAKKDPSSETAAPQPQFRRIIPGSTPQAMKGSGPIPTETQDDTPETQYATPPPRIHILGSGNLGCLIAHSLRGLRPSPPVTLLLHRRGLALDFDSVARTISVEHQKLIITRRGFDIELSNSAIENLLPAAKKIPPGERGTDHIDHLIVTTKIHQAHQALAPLAHRLSKDSTIAFIQNGMGIIEEINETVFTDTFNRPRYIVGITNHAVNSPKSPYVPFSVVLNAIGTIKLAVLPADVGGVSDYALHLVNRDATEEGEEEVYPPTTQFLLDSLCSAPDLNATTVPPVDLLTAQLEKLAANAIINPLSVLFNCRNGQLLHNPHIASVMKLLLWEISQVICSLPELASLPNRDTRFSAETLYNSVVRIARATAYNPSSMLQDVMQGRTTEVDYINGYIVQRGLQMNVPCSMNYLVQTMVKGKERLAEKGRRRDLPVEGVEELEDPAPKL